ncbi:unnamed protein product [Cylindrotheca closterium]|uniref:GH18 domain-containing protein n=1 Tax=Cylindrotheca closterium TaxID=2856 RepID=A0AAD2FGC7_9STRA|nr:unnamed protein product [Cylindrotheca closterium]
MPAVRKPPLLLCTLLWISCWMELTAALSKSDFQQRRQGRRRRLPEKVLIGYATDCNEKVAKSIAAGVNVVVWSFMEISKEISTGEIIITENSLNFDNIRQLISKLDTEGYQDTLHLVSFGGWNGPHLDTSLTAKQWYEIWKNHVGDIFDGIDWDLEGHDNLDSPTNTFSVECLNLMGDISRLANEDGYIIGMAPPQSYFDLGRSSFSRSVNLAEPDRRWHNEFHYFGSNVYAYLFSRFGAYINFVSVQLYESYSRAAMSVHYGKVLPGDYLKTFVNGYNENKGQWYVDFEQDKTLQYSSRTVELPLSKLVIGLANGWAINEGEKVIFFTSEQIQSAYRQLLEYGVTPRGFMFWVIGEEGNNGIEYAKELSSILKPRASRPSSASDL